MSDHKIVVRFRCGETEVMLARDHDDAYRVIDLIAKLAGRRLGGRSLRIDSPNGTCWMINCGEVASVKVLPNG